MTWSAPAGAPCPAPTGRWDEQGSVIAWLPLLLWLVGALTVVVIDLGGHLVAEARAAALADAAALAAVSAEASPRPEPPTAAAARVVAGGGGRLEACDCAAGQDHARVRVGVEVPGLVWPTLGPGRVVAEAEALLVAPAGPLWNGHTRAH